MHVFLHFGTFGLNVLQLILASKLSELEQFENRAENYQKASKCVKIEPMPLSSSRKGIFGWSDGVCVVKLNFKEGLLS